MKNIILLLTIIFLFSCQKEEPIIPSIPKHFELINEAELQICEENNKAALKTYARAFQHIEKPFGKDVFNAALVSGILKNKKQLQQHLQTLVNNSDDFDYLKLIFVGEYINEKEWDKIIANKEIAYNEALRQEFQEISERDQLFRPMYDTHDDTINAIRIVNLDRIIEVTKETGFPSHYELGYSKRFREHDYYLVLHHTTQRKSLSNEVRDLESLLKYGIDSGRFDPEFAILYMNYQSQGMNDFEVYSTWQTMHHSLADSLNNKIWVPKLDETSRMLANAKRAEWQANSIDAIEIKTAFLNKHKNELPFIFTSVRHSIGEMPENYTKEQALEQYNMMASFREEY